MSKNNGYRETSLPAQRVTFITKHQLFCCLGVFTVKKNLGICNLSVEVSHWRGQTSHMALCNSSSDSCRPCSHAEGSHHRWQACLEGVLTCQKYDNYSLPCNLHKPPGEGQERHTWAQLWCALANGAQHRWRSPRPPICVCVSRCVQTTFQHHELQSQMDLKMEIYTHQHSILVS